MLPPAGWRRGEPVHGSRRIGGVSLSNYFDTTHVYTVIVIMTSGDHHHVSAHREVFQPAIVNDFGGASDSCRGRGGSGFRRRRAAAGEGVAHWQKRNPAGATLRAARR